MNLKVIFVLFAHTLTYPNADNILGCNGFVKSDFPIDLSKVEIKLISKEGNVKDSVECAPNGYFFMPIYDKGNYKLQVSSKSKWTFEPDLVYIDFDGSTDVCSKGMDVNFKFAGFSVYGKVGSVSGKDNPTGITITLVADLPIEQKEISTLKTGEKGIFNISPVPPGTYIIKASHDRWRISKSLTTFVVQNDSYKIPDSSLLFAGYDVAGSVFSNEEPAAGVNFILRAQSDTHVEPAWIVGCQPMSALKGYIAEGGNSKDTRLCFARSDKEGKFRFPSLPTGNYALEPFYKSAQELKFDVRPKLVKFSVAGDSYDFPKPFQVFGFSVMGKVRTPNGKPIFPCKVTLGENVVMTKEDGTFLAENMKSGSYVVKAEADGMHFGDKTVKISPSVADIPIISPEALRVCGRVTSQQQGPQGKHATYTVVFRNQSPPGAASATSSIVLKAETDAQGKYRIFLPIGFSYVANVENKPDAAGRKLWFEPENRKIIVTDTPMEGVNFDQVKATLTGRVECFYGESRENIGLSLRNSQRKSEMQRLITNDGKYEFRNLYSGAYDISVDNARDWCWETTIFPVVINKIHNEGPVFKRNGIAISITTTHPSRLKYKKISEGGGTDKKEGYIDMKRGTSHYCFPGRGAYELRPEGCHHFDPPFLAWKSGKVEFKAISHDVTGAVLSEELVKDLYVDIYVGSDGNSEKMHRTIGPLKGIEDTSSVTSSSRIWKYTFMFPSSEGEKWEVVPRCADLLFLPPIMNVKGSSDCSETKNVFWGKLGARFRGSTTPPLAGVKVVVSNDMGQPIHEMRTDENGNYVSIPLNSDKKYAVTASKEGYIFMGPFENGLFKAQKLAELRVIMKDTEGKNLPGVLLSLSGGSNYRRTSQSGEDGEVSFLSLQAGDYFIRPMLKEYKFTPNSLSVKIDEGKTTDVVFTGLRVLYSIFGEAVTPNNMPESGITVEAVSWNGDDDGMGGQGGGGECLQHQEEATTEGENGSFRIRGLQPNCQYELRVKKSSSMAERVSTTIPEKLRIMVNVTDVTGIKVIIAPKATQCDCAVLIAVSNPDHIRSLQIKLFDEEDALVYAGKFGDAKNAAAAATASYQRSVLTTLPTLTIGSNYRLRLESNLPKTFYDYDSQEAWFACDDTFKGVRFIFDPIPRMAGEGEKRSYAGVVFLCLVAATYAFRAQLAESCASFGWYTTVNKCKLWAAKVSTMVGNGERNAYGDEPDIIAVAKKRAKVKKI